MRVKPSKFITAIAALRRQFIKVFVFSLFLNLTVLVVPLYMLQVYDRVLSSQNTDTLLLLTLLAGCLLVAMALVEIARSWLLVQSASGLDTSLNSALFKLTLTYRLEGNDASMSQPMRDLENVRAFLTGPGLPALFDSPWVPIYLAIMFVMHPIFGIIGLFGALTILILAVLSDATTNNATRKSSNANLTANSFLESLSRNADAIHAMGMVGNLNKLWLKTHQAGVAWQNVAGDRAAVVNSIAKSFRMSLQIAILGSGAWLAIQQVISPGLMIAASIVMSRALAPAEAAISNWRNMVSARQAYMRLREIFDQGRRPEIEGRTKLPAPTGRVEVEKVSMRHPGQEGWLLQNLNFNIEFGTILGIIGPNGIGKSTLVRLLIGLMKPTQGSVRLDGVEISQWPFEEFGPFVGYVPQDVELLIGTVADNISRYTEDANSDQIVSAAKLADAHDMILRLPEGYETTLGEGGSKISGGQRQRIALARALYTDANFIVLDEPNSNLDSDGQESIRRALVNLKNLGKTVIIVSHGAALLSLADKLLVLNPGNEYIFGARDAVLEKMLERRGNTANGKFRRPEAPSVKRAAQ